MGKGSHNIKPVENGDDETRRSDELVDSSDLFGHGNKVDFEKLPSLSEIKAAIPAECFQAELPTSLYYVVKDIVLVAICYFALRLVEIMVPTYSWLFYPLYWFCQGTVYTAIFVLGHDCGHGSFSSYPLINDIVGTIFHTYILAPFYPWKLTHRKHHNHTSNIDKDEVFYPKRKSEMNACAQGGFRSLPTPPGFGLSIAWWFYLFNGYSPRYVNHFNPFEKIFQNHFVGIMCSLITYAAWIAAMFFYGTTYGFFNLINYHVIPCLVFAAYIVIITFLHHNSIELPWFANAEWNYVKGQLSTIDRHYGFVHGIIHNIGTHQVHHLFTLVPHYKLERATAAFQKAFPNLVHIKNEPIVKDFFAQYKIYSKNYIIDDDVKVHYYKSD